ncbi:unnamed protein product [Orchesella dallaii]|uniref:Ubiquitin-like protease family profile domain-containing protein n=1 Tax=Orchesella dallaii TaxID=48710 RepID=A0ABP1QZI2_9HEXA
MNIFDYEIVLIPFLVEENHWTLICVDFTTKTIVHYDSYYQTSSNFMLYCEVVLNYIYLEATRLKKIDILQNIDNWKVLQEKRWPQQQNANESGIFLCLYAETLSIRAPPIFTTNDMNLHRVKIMIELLENKLQERNYDLSYFVKDARDIMENGSLTLGWMPKLNYIY